MSKRPVAVGDLAREAHVDLDDALIRLWDVGLDYVRKPTDQVLTRHVGAARRSLGLDYYKDEMAVEYWLLRTKLTRQEFTQKLSGVDISLLPNARKLPKSSLRRVKLLFSDAAPLAKVRIEAQLCDVLPTPPPEWCLIGASRDIRLLTVDEVRNIHEVLTREFAEGDDPIEPAGVRDESLLASAVFRAETSLGGALKYPTIEMAGAALFHSVVLNHAFHNGNKRTALVSLVAFLNRNGGTLTCSNEELFEFTLRVAGHRLGQGGGRSHPDAECLEIARWILANSRRLDQREHCMKWIKLRQRLKELGCRCEPAGGVGNRLNIYRTVEESERRWMRSKTKKVEFHTQVAWSGDGTDADKNVVHKIRKDLQLDDAHGYDAAAFYSGLEIDSVIADYRHILKRLAKL